MKKKRIIPCLDIKDGKTVKGVNFVGLKTIGDPVEMARFYEEQGADELVMLDISATLEGRKSFAWLVRKVSAAITIPLTVGGGITSVEDAAELLEAGASKVSVNSAAVADPSLIAELSKAFGRGKVVSAIDARVVDGVWKVTTHGGTRVSELDLFCWAHEAERLGAGEILFTSMDHDGTGKGYPCEVYRKLTSLLEIPVIASGGAGSMEDIIEVLSPEGGNADAALAASVFHYGTIRIPELKDALASEGMGETETAGAGSPVRKDFDIADLDFGKNADGLIPAIIQDHATLKVLMLGYVNAESLQKTLDTGRMTFYSRTRQCLWTKGETSGNFLEVKEMYVDCDRDTLLVKAVPCGPVCHTGSTACFKTGEDEGFIRGLEEVIRKRKVERPEGSYTVKLFDRGAAKIAQKVGEEAVETVIEAVAGNDPAMIYEASDLIYHLLVLLVNRDLSIADLEQELARRHR